MKKNVFLIGLISVLLIGGYFIVNISYENEWIDNVELYNNQVDDNQIIFDNVWKTITQKAEIANKYSDDFKDIYIGLMEGRYENDNSVAFKWIQERNPQFDASMYRELMNTIEAKRDEFKIAQKRLTSIHKNLRVMTQKFPSRLFLGNKEIPELEIVTSSKTKQTFETGEENDITLF